MTQEEKRRKIKLTLFEQSLLGILMAAEPKSLRLWQVVDRLESRKPEDVGWGLKRLVELRLAERGTDPTTWQLTSYGRKFWKRLVEEAVRHTGGGMEG